MYMSDMQYVLVAIGVGPYFDWGRSEGLSGARTVGP